MDRQGGMVKVVKYCRFVFKIMVPILILVIYILNKYILKNNYYLGISYIILLSSMVGYYTNYIAIKMLFRPKEKTCFGRQGLIPKNQNRLAESMGNGIDGNFFSPSTIIKYMNEKDIINNLFKKACELAENGLKKPEIQKIIREWTLYFIENNKSLITRHIAKFSEKNFSEMLTRKNGLKNIAKQLMELIENYIKENTHDIEKISDKIVDKAIKYIPKFVRILEKEIDKDIENSSFLKKWLKKGAKFLLYDGNEIKKWLRGKIGSAETRHRVYGFMNSQLNEFISYLQTKDGEKKINGFISKNITRIKVLVEEKGIPYFVSKIEEYLKRDDSWEAINKLLVKVIHMIEGKMNEFVSSGRFTDLLEKYMPVVLRKLNIGNMISDQVKKFDTTQLEGMIIEASGEHLGAIEILGGFLGGFTGIALFNPELFVELFGFLVLGLSIEFIATRIIRKRGTPIKIKSDFESLKPILLLYVSMIQADKIVREEELSTLKILMSNILKTFNANESLEAKAWNFCIAEMGQFHDEDSILSDLSRRLPVGSMRFLLDSLKLIALADNEFHPLEQKLLKKTEENLGNPGGYNIK